MESVIINNYWIHYEILFPFITGNFVNNQSVSVNKLNNA
jgi:hypothetical protein